MLRDYEYILELEAQGIQNISPCKTKPWLCDEASVTLFFRVPSVGRVTVDMNVVLSYIIVEPGFLLTTSR